MTIAARVRAALIGAAIAGCGGAGPGGGGGSCPIRVPPSTPRFATDLLPALQASCGSGTSTCHGPQPDGHVDFATDAARTASDVWSELVGVPPANAPPGQGWLRVAPGDVAHSWLIAKITEDSPGGAGYGARMPLAGPDVCQATVDAFDAWITAGAPLE